jgi:predicted ATPase/class 3 adenylate cyclase
MGFFADSKHSSLEIPSGTVTFLFTDIEGSTQLLQRLGDDYAKVLVDQRRILRSVIEQFAGYEVDTQGDSFFIAFQQATQAVQAAAEAQRRIAANAWPRKERLHVRMGLHTGEPRFGQTGYVGLDVHRASRICNCGHGGQVLLSGTTRALVEGKLEDGLDLRSLGEHRLKDLQLPDQLYQLLIPGLETEFPPLKSLSRTVNNLPLQLTSFIGREIEITRVKGLLKRSRLVTLLGPGGSGKTRLALQVAAELADEFPDGIWFVDLALLSGPTFLIQTVASAMNLHEETGRSVQEKLFEYLKDRQVLLILDNCEHIVAQCAALSAGLLGDCPQLSIMTTSREALGVAGEDLHPVPPLSLPDIANLGRQDREQLSTILDSEAVCLFADRAERVQPGFSLTEANLLPTAQICQRLDGIPLAIELAAARTRMMSLEQILARLDDRFRLLTGGSRTALPRQQTLLALVAWSYDLLSPHEKALFIRLSVFAGGWSLDAAEAVCTGGEAPDRSYGITRTEVLDLLTHLVDKSLVVADPGGNSPRFRMLETIREYARDQLREVGEEENLRRRHLDYYFIFALQSEETLKGTDPSGCLRQMDEERDNLYTALDWSLKRSVDGGDLAMEMAGGLWMWWLARGSLSEGHMWLKKTLDAGPNRSSSRAKALASAGVMTWQLGELKEGSLLLEESIAILHEQQTPDLPGLANAAHLFGHTTLDLKDYPSAQKAFSASLDLYRKLDDQYYVGTLISDLGMVAFHLGDYSSARSHQEESLAIFQELGNSEVISQTLHRLGELARLEGDYGRAEECYESCLITYMRIGMRLEIASNLHKLGYIAQHKGDYPKALARFRESMEIQSEAGNKQGIAECLAGFAGLAAVTGDPGRSLRIFGAAQSLLDASGIPLSPADLAEWARDQAAACRQLDAAACLQAQEEGRSMPLDDAITYAFGNLHQK